MAGLLLVLTAAVLGRIPADHQQQIQVPVLHHLQWQGAGHLGRQDNNTEEVERLDQVGQVVRVLGMRQEEHWGLAGLVPPQQAELEEAADLLIVMN